MGSDTLKVGLGQTGTAIFLSGCETEKARAQQLFLEELGILGTDIQDSEKLGNFRGGKKKGVKKQETKVFSFSLFLLFLFLISMSSSWSPANIIPFHKYENIFLLPQTGYHSLFLSFCFKAFLLVYFFEHFY